MQAFKTIVLWPLFAAILLTMGCATAPQSNPPNALAALPQEGSGRIVFYRPNGIFGYGMRSDILLDGKKVGRSVPGTQFYVDTSPGIHHIVVPNSLYSGDRTLDITVVNKELVYVRTSLGGSAFGGRTNVELVLGPQGAQEVAGLELVIY